MWMRIAILTLGTFAIGTDGFVVAGVLGDISGQLDVGIAKAGQLVTLFAWVYALSSPVIASITGRIPRRRLLLSAIAAFVAANVLAALATGYPMLAAGRVIAALAAATYTPSATVAAMALVEERFRGRALALVLGGITAATIIGVPLGTWLSQYGGFRAAFWLVTALGTAALAGLTLWLPELPASPTARMRERLHSLRLPGVSGILLVTVLAMTAGFTVYTYIGPLLSETLGADTRTLGLILMVFGVAGALGNALSGWLVDHWGTHRTTVLSLTIVTLALVTLPSMSKTLAGALTAVFIWNGAGWLLLPAQQHRLLALSPPHAGPLLISLNASALYLGIGLAGALGGVIIHASGTKMLGLAAAAMESMALFLYLYAHRSAVQHRVVRSVLSEAD